MQTDAATVENSREFPQKIIMELSFDPVRPLLEIYPKNSETAIGNNICTLMFIAAQFTIARIWKQPRCLSADDWIKKLWYIYTMEYYAAIKKKEFSSFAATWMKVENIMLSEISQSMKEKHHMASLIYG